MPAATGETMASDNIGLLDDQLRQLQRRVDLIDYRLHSLELWRGGQQETAPPPMPLQQEAPKEAEIPVETRPVQPVVPPPVIRQPVVQQSEAPSPYVWQPRVEEINERTSQIPPPKEAQDTEYMIGAKLLPKLGAGLVLLGVLFFVAWGYSSGWITPLMVFSGEILFCLGFIGVGQWKRNEREQFGQILTGIGSCGLYLSVAGGHLVQDLFSGNAMVITFMAFSFANLAYGLASKSKAFLAIDRKSVV